MAEAGASVRHVEREADAFGEHFVDAGDHIAGRACLVSGAPLVKPAAPELAAHAGSVRAQLAEPSELLIDIRAGSEVHCPRQIVERVLFEVRGPVALEESHLVAVDTAEAVTDFGHVWLVLAVGAILVLHLNHNDGSTVLNRERFELFAHFFLKNFDPLHEVRVEIAQLDVFFSQKPPRQASHLPFGADVWSGTDNDVHAELARDATELRHVQIACKVEFSLGLLVDVPEYVDADSVHAEGFAHPDAMLPILAWDSRIVELCGFDDDRLSVEEESTFASGEGVRSRRARAQQSHQHADYR